MVITEHADPVKVIQIAADVVPTPVAASVQNGAVLFAVVIIGLFATPRRFVDFFPRHPAPRP